MMKPFAKLNPGLKLPSQNIAVVRRADGSGNSFVFTSYLAKVNEEWKKQRWYWLYRKMADRSGR
ncbi:phosphate ABC transporter substrate-binding protein [Escherichia coli]|uniref:Phosphate ABC transporter substrate-binding protein n=1 Tax=Escherichia coli TaxID=562 RepID=A0A377B415_ECOLX|nr:phosphate ABC transporter substrate-binding protein [Escherichia coli]